MIVKIIKISGISLIVLITLFVVVEFINYHYEKYQFEHTESDLQLADTHQVWAHAGLHDKYEINSIQAFKKAYESGAKGIEIDTHFDTKLSKFVLSHDYPYKKFDGELKFLDEVFQILGQKVFYWVDLKNLSMSNYQQVAVRMTGLIEKYNLQQFVFIESFRGKPLSLLSKMNLKTVYWVGFSAEVGTIDYLISLHKMRALVRRSKFIAISMPYQTFLKVGGKTFAEFPLFVFTVNNQELLKKIVSHQWVQVVLTDNPKLYR